MRRARLAPKALHHQVKAPTGWSKLQVLAVHEYKGFETRTRQVPDLLKQVAYLSQLQGQEHQMLCQTTVLKPVFLTPKRTGYTWESKFLQYPYCGLIVIDTCHVLLGTKEFYYRYHELPKGAQTPQIRMDQLTPILLTTSATTLRWTHLTASYCSFNLKTHSGGKTHYKDEVEHSYFMK